MKGLPPFPRPSRRSIAIGCAAAAAAGVIGIALRARAVGLRAERFIARDIHLAIRDAPPWLPEDERRILERPPVLPKSFSVFDRRVREALARWYEGRPWVDRVLWAGPMVPGRGEAGVAVRLRLRSPVAAVRIGDRAGGPYLWIDEEGRALGSADAPPSRFRLPALAGIRHDAELPAPGEIFAARPVVEGLALISFLRRGGILDRTDRRVDVVDAARVGRKDVPELSLVLDDGRVLDWGRGPASAFAPIVPQEEILENLKAILDRGIGRPGEPFPLYRPIDLELARRRREGLALAGDGDL
ncbi:MAG: hypothetical protein JXP34_05990 [Planctomycetes bacterium]|nr:hypothetical protein [Planctomycetota bacterium]